MSTFYVISVKSKNLRACRIADHIPVAFHVEGPDLPPSQVGNIYKGRVLRIDRTLGAAFIDLGLEHPALLPLYSDVIIHEGAAILVEVSHEPHLFDDTHKGAKVTWDIGLQSEHLVYLPRSKSILFSKKITYEHQQDLKKLLKSSITSKEGLLVRTQAISQPIDVLRQEISSLKEQWQNIAANNDAAPKLLLQQRNLWTFIESPTRIAVDSYELFMEIKAHFPVAILEFYKGSHLFEHYHLQEVWENLFEPVTVLPCGGNIIIEKTSALISIDVNSSSFQHKSTHSPIQVNREAAPIIANQIMLRNLRGHILIDFIHMKDLDCRNKTLLAMKNALKEDNSALLTGTSPFGLVEIVRKAQGNFSPELAQRVKWD
jgi:ribonuclease G